MPVYQMTILNVDEDVKQLNLSYVASENITRYNDLKKICYFLIKLSVHLPLA